MITITVLIEYMNIYYIGDITYEINFKVGFL